MSVECWVQGKESSSWESQISHLTVGEKFSLKCQGEVGLSFSEGLYIQESQPEGASSIPRLSLLEVVNQDSNSFELIVTSYHVGDHSLDGLVLTDGTQSLKLAGARWNVQTVLEAQKEEAQQEPYPTYPAWEMSYPYWFIAVSVILVIGFVTLPILIYKKVAQRKLDFEGIQEHLNVLVPIDSFYKEMRSLEKQFYVEAPVYLELVQEIEKQLRLYMTRAFEIPVTIWSIGHVLKEIRKKNYSLHKKISPSIQKFFLELKNAKNDLESVTYFLRKAQQLAELIDGEVYSRKRPR